MADKNYPTYIPKCVLITGATGGFGQAFAKRFVDAGCKLILHGRNAEKLDALAAQFDVPVYKLLFDIKDKEATIRAIEEIPDDFKDIDVLINNAGGALGLDKAHEALIEDWEDMIEMNNTSLVRITRLILPGMVKRKSGHVINIGSVAGNYVYPGANVYGAVKAFVKQFSLNIRADLVGTNVRVTNIEPGIVATPFSLARFKGDKEKADAVYANTTPLVAEDVAESVFWAATLPEHVNINRLELMPTKQTHGPLIVERDG
jgi:3-hydroxy acid dehydrogenase/malonic semialdehyde reductase